MEVAEVGAFATNGIITKGEEQGSASRWLYASEIGREPTKGRTYMAHINWEDFGTTSQGTNCGGCAQYVGQKNLWNIFS